MKSWSLFIFLLIILACERPKRANEKERSKFSNSQSSVLFFNNVRQIYYDRTQVQAAKTNLYRHEDRGKAKNRPIINLAIANSWLTDKSYILVEPNEYFKDWEKITVTWTDTLAQDSGTYEFVFGNTEEQYIFAGQINQSILKDHKLQILTPDSARVNILDNDDEREAIRITMIDFYRLVE